jgi:exonuclease SbcD
LIDEAALRKHAEKTFEFHFVKRPQIETRVRLPEDQSVSSLSPIELLDIYWRAAKVEDSGSLQKLAREIIEGETEA